MSDNERRVWIRKRTCKDGRTTYHGRWKDEQGKWHSKKLGSDPEKAEKRAARLAVQLERGETAAVKRCAWQEFVDEHCASLLGAEGAGKVHAEAVRRALDGFAEMMGVERVKDVTLGKVEAWMGKLAAKGMMASTIRQRLIVFRGAMSRAVDRGYLFKNPAAKAKAPRAEDPVPREITEDEERALLKKCEELEEKRLATFVRVAIGTGGRREELRTLPWERIDLAAGEVLFTKTKAKRARRVPLRPDLVAELRRIVPATQQQGGPFCHWTITDLNRTFRTVADAAGLPDVTPHSCRDTFISRLLRKGVAITTVAKLAGHADITTTARYYASVTPEDYRNAVNLLGAVAG